MPKTFEKDFISYCNNQELEVNPNQIAVIKKLEQYYQSNFKSFFSKLFSKQNSKKGFYLFGGVGVGKTMILNFFFDQVDQKKLRQHFNEFMLNFHDFVLNDLIAKSISLRYWLYPIVSDIIESEGTMLDSSPGSASHDSSRINESDDVIAGN